MKKPSRNTKSPTYLVDVIYAGSRTKTQGMKLSYKTYGPAQCKLDTVRFGGENIENSYTAGWVFLAPQVAAAAVAAAPAAVAAAPAAVAAAPAAVAAAPAASAP